MAETINEQLWVNITVEKIIHKMEVISEKHKDGIPYTTDENGTYDNRADRTINYNRDDGINWWTNGFWGGMLWQLYHVTKQERYAQIAKVSEEILDDCFVEYYGLHHDVGFMWLPTAVANYRLTGNEDAKRRAMHAANLLAGRFNPVGKYIRAWNDIPGSSDDTRGWAIIDSMLNIPLLYWAYEETKDPRFKHIAVMHANTIQENFIRPDGSVNHIVEFDPENGGMVKSHGGQGYGVGSSWTRGQGWALYGFVLSYIHTGDSTYLDTAKKVAHYIMANLTQDAIVPVDFRQPQTSKWEDSCGAAVIASGLLELAKQVPEIEEAMYKRVATSILKTLTETRCDFTLQCDAIVQNCTAAYHCPTHHVTMNYADYYYLEAMLKLQEKELFIW